ncbi:hypothetical protein [Burkholderia cenocepacia]|uniref:Uncharacterized protein n=1 Tax=Burkholderia cenocepacia TaxID=95486 RepID=A0A3S9N8N5_9BURK|nr:hypothetical protein [Burkholderia cenocepacia]AZQ52019.1 hypothetical protein D5R55_13930 [Burkholderia cenocepacia]
MNRESFKNDARFHALASRDSSASLAFVTVTGVNFVDKFGATLTDVSDGVAYQVTNDSIDAGIVAILCAARTTGAPVLVAFNQVGPAYQNQQNIVLHDLAY